MKNTKQQLQEEEYEFPYHYMDIKSHEYRLIRNVEYLSKIDFFKQLLKQYDCHHILDAGCGDGRIVFELNKVGFNCTGVDLSDRAIAFARAFNPHSRFHIQDLTRLSVEGKFDAILLIETLEHIAPENINQILERIADHLTDNGIVIITVPSVNKKLEEKHYQHFTQKSLEGFVSKVLVPLEYFGYTRIGLRKAVFNILKRFGYYLYPLRRSLTILDSYYLFFRWYYRGFTFIGKPNNCQGIIAICKKR